MPQEGGNSWNLQYTAGDAGHGTDLEAAIREAIGTLPGGMVRRVVLISGWQRESGERGARRLAGAATRDSHRHVRAGGRSQTGLRVESVSLPSLVFSGERFPIDVTVNAPRRAQARLEITAEGKTLGLSDVALEPAMNHLRVRASVTATGAVDLAGKISGTGAWARPASIKPSPSGSRALLSITMIPREPERTSKKRSSPASSKYIWPPTCPTNSKIISS